MKYRLDADRLTLVIMAKTKKTASAKKSGQAGKSRAAESNSNTAGTRPLRILFAASEVYPLIKTGGLADVACYLPTALHELGHDIRIVLPAYHSVLDRISGFRPARERPLKGYNTRYRLLRGRLPGSEIPVYLIDIPELFNRPGDPYRSAAGEDWQDNARRFAVFGDIVRQLGMGQAGLRWRPEIVHCNDWHTGLAPALLALDADRPATVFSIHNLAFQGDFSYDTFKSLPLPDSLWSPEAMEFYGRFAFIKGGLVFADRLVTVSPSYAGEILTPEYGFGMEGLLHKRGQDLSGILNGVDYRYWDPRHDSFIDRHYWINSLNEKAVNKRLLQKQLGLQVDGDAVLLAHISRLTWQKGTDLILDGASTLLQNKHVQIVVLGSGEVNYVTGLQSVRDSHPGRVAISVEYNEALSHRIQSGADILLMPSRYEPCGLTQMYSLRYGTIPVVRRTGGLADTVVNTTAETLASGTATGFHFDDSNTSAFLSAVYRALEIYPNGDRWGQIMQTAMSQDFCWGESARRYESLYLDLVYEKSGKPDR